MLSRLEARGYQIATLGVGVVALALGTSLAVTTVQRDKARAQAEQLHAEIHEPVTGYIARLASCKASVAGLTTSIEHQNQQIDQMRRQSEERIAAVETALAAAQRQAANDRVRAERLAGATINGQTMCERVEDVDRQVMEILR